MKGLHTYVLVLLGLACSLHAIGSAASNCLTKAEADDVISRFTSIALDVKKKVVDETVTDDFRFFSDNQDFLEGLPPGSKTGIPSVANKTDLIQQQEAAQAPGTPVIPKYFTIIRSGHSCNEITFHWRFHAVAGGTDPSSTNKKGDPIAYGGIDWLILTPSTKLINTAYSEWNSGELLYDLGTRTCFQKGNASACS